MLVNQKPTSSYKWKSYAAHVTMMKRMVITNVGPVYIGDSMVSIINTNGIKELTRGYQNYNTSQISR